jgi:hypothetical protein
LGPIELHLNGFHLFKILFQTAKIAKIGQADLASRLGPG